MIDELTEQAQRICRERYPTAAVTFLAGSLVRGEGTRTSDLDLVVVFGQLPHAYRESYIHEGRPVEAFVHDPETLAYFFWDVDRPTGIPSLATMVVEGVEIPAPTPLSQSLKASAQHMLQQGPPPWSTADIDRSRYAITSWVDDLRDPRSRSEQVATATALYGAMADHYFRSRGLWSGRDKSIPRRLRSVDATFAVQFEEAFEAIFRDGRVSRVLAIAEAILKDGGGWLFDGYQLRAPGNWRRGPKDSAPAA